MKVDLHNHTPLCNHAEGSYEEYIQTAINVGTQVFGFSDHAPMEFDPKYRMDFSLMQTYQNAVLEQKRHFQGKIDIKLGYEVDFIPNLIDKRVVDADVDYLIGSVHFLDKWGFDNPEFLSGYKERDIDEIWRIYFDLITQMAQTKLFDIVGHIDLIKVFQFYPKKDILEYATPALEAIKEADMVLELNTAGYRKPCKEPYPSKAILQKAYELDIPITFGSDAHKPDQVGMFSQEIETLAKEIGYKKCAIFTSRQREMVNF